MSQFERWVAPLQQKTTELSPTGGAIEYEDFPSHVDVTGPLLYYLFQENWQQLQVGHVIQGSVLELEFTEAPKLCVLYDGYLTVVTQAWHLHLCLEPHLGGADKTTPESLRRERLVSRAALYRSLDSRGKAQSWGIQFWNGGGEKMMSLFLPNPYLGAGENLLPEGKANFEKLALYEELREIYILGKQPIPYRENPLKRPYLAVCRSSRCYPSQKWQPIAEALETAVKAAGLEVAVQTAGCLQVCKLGPVVYYSGDSRSEELREQTWYTCVTPEVARRIVSEHLVKGEKVTEHLYPSSSKSKHLPARSETLDTTQTRGSDR